LLFFVLSRRPPSTLFPYTTLFRSRGRCGVLVAGVCEVWSIAALCTFAALVKSPALKSGLRFGRWRRASDAGVRYPDQSVGRGSTDRKSTRLNSSHVKISYAVFCLK